MVGKVQNFSRDKKKFGVNLSLWAKFGVFHDFFPLFYRDELII